MVSIGMVNKTTMLATSWLAGFAPPRSPPSCQCMSSCGIKYSSLAIKTVATSVKQWSYPQQKRRVNNSLSRSPRRISLSSQIQTRWCPRTCYSSLLFSSSVKQLTKRLLFLRRTPRTRSSQKRRRRLIFPSHAAVNLATWCIIATSTVTIIKATDAATTTDEPIIIIETIYPTIILVASIRTTRAVSPMRRRMTASMSDHLKKKSNKAMHNDLLFVEHGHLIQKRCHSCSRSPSRSRSGSWSCLSSRNYNNHHVSHDDHKPSALRKCGYSYSSERNDNRCIYRPEKSDNVFATFSTPTAKIGKHTPK